jgi:hypothetical protein
MLEDMKINNIITSYIYRESQKGNVPFFDEDLQNFYLIINILQYIYGNSTTGESPVSDYDYDKLYEIMLNNGGNDVISTLVQNDAESDYHLYPELRGTLDKIYYLTKPEKSVNKSRKTLDDWIRTSEDKIFKETGKKVNLNNEEIWVFPKWDGVSAVMEMNENGTADKVLQRGDTDTNKGTNITRFFDDFTRKSEFKGKKYGLKCELMMEERDLNDYNKKYNTDYNNTRSIVSSIFNTHEVDERFKLVTPVPLRVRTIDGHEEVAREAFNEYLAVKAEVKKNNLQPIEAIDLLNGAGGIIIKAHSVLMKQNSKIIKKL